MLLGILAYDKDVINEDENEREINVYRIHKSLESLCGIFEPKRHPDELIKFKRGYDGCLWNISRSNWYLVISMNLMRRFQCQPGVSKSLGCVG